MAEGSRRIGELPIGDTINNEVRFGKRPTACVNGGSKDAARKLGGNLNSASSHTSRDPVDAAYQPLATVALEPVDVVTEDSGGVDMGFAEQYEKPEGRDGDALAQVIAFVSCALLDKMDKAVY